jgi:hypothetical protein
MKHQHTINTIDKTYVTPIHYVHYLKFEFKEYSFDTVSEIDCNIIKIENNIYYFPNIISRVTNNYIQNLSGCMFMFIEEINKLIIIPGYLVLIFYNKYPIFDLNFKLINYLNIYNFNINKIEIFKESIIYKILNDEYDDNEKIDINIHHIIHCIVHNIHSKLTNKIKKILNKQVIYTNHKIDLPKILRLDYNYELFKNDYERNQDIYMKYSNNYR